MFPHHNFGTTQYSTKIKKINTRHKTNNTLLDDIDWIDIYFMQLEVKCCHWCRILFCPRTALTITHTLSLSFPVSFSLHFSVPLHTPSE